MIGHYRNTLLNTVLSIGTADDMALDPSGGKWCAVCETHGAILNTSSRALAVSAARYPDYCEECSTTLSLLSLSPRDLPTRTLRTILQYRTRA